MNNKSKILKSVSLIALLTLISRILGLLRDVITASKFGTSSELDMFFAASNIPMILFMAIGTAISTTLIPLYNEKLIKGKEEANTFANNVLNLFILSTSIITILFIIFSKSIVSFLNPGFNNEQLKITIYLSIILVPTLIVNSVIYIFNGVLQSEGNFNIPSIISLPLNIITIIYLIVYGKNYGVVGLTIITLIATTAQLIPQIPFLIRQVRYHYKFILDFKDKHLRKMAIMIVPVILGTCVQQINSFVERGFATKYSTGSLSALSYSYRVFTLFVDIFVMTLSTVVYTVMSKHTAANEIDKMKSIFIEYLNLIILFLIPISLIVILESKPIIFVVFERGAFNRSSTVTTSGLLMFYSIGLLAYGIRDFICKAFYAIKDTRTPMINSAIAMFFNIIFIILFQRFLGLNGLGLANATSTYLASILLLIQLRRKIGSLNIKNTLVTFCKTIISSVAMLVVMYILNKLYLYNLNSTILVLIKLSVFSVIGLMIFTITGIIINLGSLRKVALLSAKRLFKI